MSKPCPLKIDNDLSPMGLKREYVKIAGSLHAGSLLSQVVYWHLPSKSGSSKLRVYKRGLFWIAKTREAWMEECCLTEWQFRQARKSLENRGIITTRVMKFKGDPTIHTRLNEERLKELLNGEFSKPFLIASQVPSGDALKSGVEHLSSSLTETESTTQKTAESTSSCVHEHAKTGASVIDNSEAGDTEKTKAKNENCIEKYWQSKLAVETHHALLPMTAKEKGQLRKFEKDLGDAAIACIDYAFKSWWKFGHNAKACEGLSCFPEKPNLAFMCKYRQILLNLWSDSIAKSAEQESELKKIKPQEPVQLAPPKLAGCNSQGEVIYKATQEEIDALMAYFEPKEVPQPVAEQKLSEILVPWEAETEPSDFPILPDYASILAEQESREMTKLMTNNPSDMPAPTKEMPTPPEQESWELPEGFTASTCACRAHQNYESNEIQLAEAKNDELLRSSALKLERHIHSADVDQRL